MKTSVHPTNHYQVKGRIGIGRPRLIQDDELLAIAKAAFIEKGIAVSTREIARRANISEAVIYQRHPTKEDLFFAAMVPPAFDVEELLKADVNDRPVPEQLEEIALCMLEYFRELMPTLLTLMSHPAFEFEDFARRNPNSPLSSMRTGLMEFLQTQQTLGNIGTDDTGPAALSLFAALHSLAIFERLGVHGGQFDEEVVRAMVRSQWNGIAPAKK